MAGSESASGREQARREVPTVKGGRMTTIALQRAAAPRNSAQPSILRSSRSKVGHSRYSSS